MAAFVCHPCPLPPFNPSTIATKLQRAREAEHAATSQSFFPFRSGFVCLCVRLNVVFHVDYFCFDFFPLEFLYPVGVSQKGESQSHPIYICSSIGRGCYIYICFPVAFSHIPTQLFRAETKKSQFQ